MVPSRQASRDVVVNGARFARGMPRFGDLDDRDLEALTHHIRQMAQRAAGNRQAAKCRLKSGRRPRFL
jgi:hypothetical protein